MLKHFSVCTGIGGIDLAAEWAGFETVGQCEYADYPTKVLEKHWPNVPRWRDIRDVTSISVTNRGIGEIDLLSAGIPCQPHSVAGKRKASFDERDLWPEFKRIIGELRPRWVLVENVRGLLTSEDGRFFGGILRDMAYLGYAVGWCCYRAADIGAVHGRPRVFIVGDSIGNRSSEVRTIHEGQNSQSCGDDKIMGYPERCGLSWQFWRRAGQEFENGHIKYEDVANTKSSELQYTVNSWRRRNGSANGSSLMADTISPGREEHNPSAESAGQRYSAWSSNENGSIWPVESRLGGSLNGIPYWLGQHIAPAPYGAAQYDWEPPRVATGVRNRAAQIKCYGNAVQPQQVFPVLKEIADIEYRRR